MKTDTTSTDYPSEPSWLWDVFCRVIDNYGDIGVCWRLCCELSRRGQQVRLWTDDAQALRWMAGHDDAAVQVLDWPAADIQAEPGEVLVEAFGCEVAPEFVAAFAANKRAKAWINLEYLSAEPYVQRSHGLPSPVMHGPGAGLTKHFFYPGFTAGTGGLLREAHLLESQRNFNAAAWLSQQGISEVVNAQRVSLFCYEPSALHDYLQQCQNAHKPTQLLVTAGRAAQAVRQYLSAAGVQLKELNQPDALAGASGQLGMLHWHFLPFLTQTDYDHLLWSCDLNFVRGEDSLVRALWSAKPFVWQIYPQDDGAHLTKLQAFLDWLPASPHWRTCHQAWNSSQHGATPTAMPMPDTAAIGPAVLAARTRLLEQADLVSQLMAFVQQPTHGVRPAGMGTPS